MKEILKLMAEAADRLESWAQNEEMIDTHYTQHGDDCMRAAQTLRIVIEEKRELGSAK